MLSCNIKMIWNLEQLFQNGMHRYGIEGVHECALRQCGVMCPARSWFVFYDVTHRHTAHLRCVRPDQSVVFVLHGCTTAGDVESFVVNN